MLLCDLIMPGMDGFELLERLNSGLVKDVPAVIVISALRQEEMVRQACTLGAKYYMVKPIDPDTLYKRIMDMMESTYAQRSQVCAISPKPQTLDEKIKDIAAIRCDEAADGAQNRGFAAAGGSEQCYEFAVTDGEVEVL